MIACCSLRSCHRKASTVSYSGQLQLVLERPLEASARSSFPGKWAYVQRLRQGRCFSRLLSSAALLLMLPPPPFDPQILSYICFTACFSGTRTMGQAEILTASRSRSFRISIPRRRSSRPSR